MILFFPFLQFVPDSPSPLYSNKEKRKEKKRAMERTGKRERVERGREPGEKRKREGWRRG